MSTRTDWGWFDKDGKPVAVGDEHWKWTCPHRRFVPSGFEHPMTGEWIDNGPVLEGLCPTGFVAPGREECNRCGNRFIYP